MSPPPAPIEGGCRCGSVRLRVTAAPILTMACHCTGCQKMTASAFSLSSLYAEDGFEHRQGEVVIGGLHGETRHFHCQHCLGWVFTRPHGLPGIVNLRAMVLDDARAYVPFVELWTREMLPWATTGAEHSFAGIPSPQEFGQLAEAFRARG